jgi:23S rRNA (guanosine2251-2'-O)-methyltransferase
MRDELIYGIHVVQSVLKNSPERILELYFLDTRQDTRLSTLKALANEQGIAMSALSRKQLGSLGEDIHHQGVMAKVRPKTLLTEYDLIELITSSKTPPLLLILDQVQDPHNLGACLRTADATGVTAVIIPKDRSAGLTSVVRKTASGAVETVPCVEVTNLARCLEDLKQQGVWVMGASGEAKQSLFETDLKGPLALVLGAEGTGLRRLTLDKCDVLMHIPMKGSVESLNVSVAAGVCLYEAVRQRS